MASQQDTDDDAYISAEDEDFNPEVDDALSESSDDDDHDAPQSKQRSKKKRRADENEDLDFNNSGDETTIELAKRKKAKHGIAQGQADEEGGGEGGLVKTRAQRQAEKLQERDAPQLKDSGVDVNALWAQMSGDAKKSGSMEEKKHEKNVAANGAESNRIDQKSSHNNDHHNLGVSTNSDSLHKPDKDTVTITRTYDFAGETITEKREVTRDSAEAKLYLAQEQEAAAAATAKLSSTKTQATKPGVRRPMRKSLIPGVGESNFSNNSKATKLNTVQKSRLDWAKLVDEEGLGDELDEHRKAKDTYLGRMDFLDRMSARDEENRRGTK